MGIRAVLLALAAVAVLVVAREVASRRGDNDRVPASVDDPVLLSGRPVAAQPPSLPSPQASSPAAAPVEDVARAVGGTPHEVTLSEGARLVFETAVGAQEIGGSIDLATSVASDPEMRQALLGEVSRRLASAQGELRCRLLAILAALGDPQGFALWMAALESDPDAHCREALARYPVTHEPYRAEALAAVLSCARTDREAAVRLAAFEGLPAGLSKERMDVFLAAIAGDPEPSVRHAALAYLSEDARGDERLQIECKRLVADEGQAREVRLLASAILRDAKSDALAPADPDAKPNETDLDRSMPTR